MPAIILPVSERKPSMSTFLLTWNPDKWFWDPSDQLATIKQTSSGLSVKDQWSTGSRKKGITPGKDRFFLLRLGSEPRGIIGTGLITSPVFQGPHWDPNRPGEIANYVKVTWDVLLEDDDLLPLALVRSQIARKDDWEPQGGGVLLEPPADVALETLWASHLRQAPPRPKGQGQPKPRRVVKRSKSQGWQNDPIKRKLVEDHAQALLERRFRHKGWKVSDTRRGNPFDAVATKGKKTRYLEAKGTERDGASILVTPREVRYARAHLGKCVIGIVSGIRFQSDGTLDPSSGTLATHNWDPDDGVLKPAGYTWAPPPGA